MAFDEHLADRVRRATAGERGIGEKRMFGGLCFLVHGNLCCGVDADDLFVRTDPEGGAALFRRKHASAFAPNGRPMRGWVKVDRAGLRDARALRSWLRPALEFARNLPRKSSAK